MKIDGGVGTDLTKIAAEAKRAEATGYDGVWSAETSHDPFLPLVIAAEHTESIDLGTGIVVAFARSPMTTANVAWDLQLFSGGRFHLGLGSQIRPHIERRFSMTWSHPAARMKEFIAAMRAIWGCWQDDTKLDFRGDFYQHTLMTPMFNPGPSPYGPPTVWLAAVGEKMTEVAAEVADGMLVHAFTTERYLREVTIPTLDRVLAKSGHSRPADFQLSIPAFVVTGNDETEVETSAEGVKRQIAFYGSTPAYRPVLERHGWGELQTELNTLSKRGEWVKMGTLIDDEILGAFAIVAEPDAIPSKLLERYGDIIDRVSFYAPAGMSQETLGALVTGVKSGPGPVAS